MAHGRIIYSEDPRGKRPNRYFVDGTEVPKKVYDAAFPSRPVNEDNVATTLMETSKAWPRISDALGVGKGQKEKAEALFAKKGVPTEFVPDGAGGYSAKILNNAHQRDVLKAFGLHNNHAGYGSVTG